ncbi:unnamed protein product, partial [Didymodactylos carnosus]
EFGCIRVYENNNRHLHHYLSTPSITSTYVNSNNTIFPDCRITNRSLSKYDQLDLDVARSFLNVPSDAISYVSIPMHNDCNRMMMLPSYTTTTSGPTLQSSGKTTLTQSPLPLPFSTGLTSTQLPFQTTLVPNQISYPLAISDAYSSNLTLPSYSEVGKVGYPVNTNIMPMYYDLIIDTVTDYDIFYPVAQQTERYDYNQNDDHVASESTRSDIYLNGRAINNNAYGCENNYSKQQQLVSGDPYQDGSPFFNNDYDNKPDFSYPRYSVQRLDELTASMHFQDTNYDGYDNNNVNPFSDITNTHFNESSEKYLLREDDYQQSQLPQTIPLEKPQLYDRLVQSSKNVRFNDTPSWILLSQEAENLQDQHEKIHYKSSIRSPQSVSNNVICRRNLPSDYPLSNQYYFHNNNETSTDHSRYPSSTEEKTILSSNVRYIYRPFFWFRPVTDQNMGICIPHTRPTLHASLTGPHMNKTYMNNIYVSNDVRF